jgi:hypothetical protein
VVSLALHDLYEYQYVLQVAIFMGFSQRNSWGVTPIRLKARAAGCVGSQQLSQTALFLHQPPALLMTHPRGPLGLRQNANIG